MKRLPRLIAILVLLSFLGGCVWLRLLQLKNQLADFDENFVTEIGDHFALVFRHPVLLNDDFVELAKLEPTRKEPTPTGSRWVQAFRKVDSTDKVVKPEVEFFFTLDFNQDDYLTRWDFSPVFMVMAPPQFFEASIRSLGKGKVDEARHKFVVDERDRARITVKPPTIGQIVAKLGEPLQKTEEDGKKLYVYRFLVDSPHIDKDYPDRRFTNVKLYFDPKSGELAKMGGKFIGLKIAIDLKKLGEQKETTAANP